VYLEKSIVDAGDEQSNFHRDNSFDDLARVDLEVN